MSRAAEITLEFAGEERFFRFRIGEHRRLQDALDVGVSEIVQSLHPYVQASREKMGIGQILALGLLGAVRVQHIHQVIFQGLIGGGMTPVDAGRLCQAWVLERPVLENAAVAYFIGIAALIGTEDEKPAGEPAGEGAPPSSPKARSGSGKTGSTPSAARRGSRPAKSTT
jgi:hypothetical protein